MVSETDYSSEKCKSEAGLAATSTTQLLQHRPIQNPKPNATPSRHEENVTMMTFNYRAGRNDYFFPELYLPVDMAFEYQSALEACVLLQTWFPDHSRQNFNWC
eukprot:6044381-Amphidinium_carterae.1